MAASASVPSAARPARAWTVVDRAGQRRPSVRGRHARRPRAGISEKEDETGVEDTHRGAVDLDRHASPDTLGTKVRGASDQDPVGQPAGVIRGDRDQLAGGREVDRGTEHAVDARGAVTVPDDPGRQ